MKVSARNVFRGIVTGITDGEVNSEVELTLPGGDKIVTIATAASVRRLGLRIGSEAEAWIKAPWVMLLAGSPDHHFSARNQWAGIVSTLSRGAVNTEVAITLASGTVVHAVITNEAVLELGLKPGASATALIKASHVILAEPV